MSLMKKMARILKEDSFKNFKKHAYVEPELDLLEEMRTAVKQHVDNFNEKYNNMVFNNTKEVVSLFESTPLTVKINSEAGNVNEANASFIQSSRKVSDDFKVVTYSYDVEISFVDSSGQGGEEKIKISNPVVYGDLVTATSTSQDVEGRVETTGRTISFVYNTPQQKN